MCAQQHSHIVRGKMTGESSTCSTEYDIRINLMSTRPPGFRACNNSASCMDSASVCASCHIRPVRYGSPTEICSCCEPRRDTGSSCYACPACVETRAYLIDTDPIFTLSGYGSLYGQQTELWNCSRCLHYLEIQSLPPGMVRDTIHATGRRIHTEHWCELLRNQEITLS